MFILSLLLFLWYRKNIGMKFQYEKKVAKKFGYQYIAGIDEVGRGPLAGPVVACAFMFLSHHVPRSVVRQVRDSKVVSHKKRCELFRIFCEWKNEGIVDFETASVRPATIDALNIQKATIIAMRRAFSKLKTRPQYVIVDKISHQGTLLSCDYEVRVKADRDVLSCAAASIVGKVRRDSGMVRYHTRYPEYGFARHKGYPTAAHYAALRRYGTTNIHRKSFRLA